MFSPNSGSLKSGVAPAAHRAGGNRSCRPNFLRGRGRRLCCRRGLFRGRLRSRRFGLGSLRFRARPVFHGEDHLADFYFLPFFDANFLDRAADRRWNLDHRLVGFQFHDGLAFGDARTERDHQPDQVALVNVFAEFRKLEFCH